MCTNNLILFHWQSAEELEQRIQALEAGKQYQATQAAVRKVEEEYLLKLREIREAIAKEGPADSKELQALRQENVELKKKNDKLEYRVQHMLESMEMLYKCKTELEEIQAKN